jgi:hypothetical protein
MKKLLLLLFIFVFSIFSIQNTFAQNATSSSQVKHVEYDLPYPGILPDSPLYFLKAVRDNFLALFITDPLKTSEYDLLMADKRLASSKSLVDLKKYDLAITTLSKSGNYFDKAIQKAAEAKRQGKNADSILDKLLVSSQKHQEIIFQMVQKTKGDTRYNFELLQVRAKNFQNTVEVIKSN